MDESQLDKQPGPDIEAVARTEYSDQVETERPGVEQYFTAAPGAGLFSSGVQQDQVGDAEKVERPPVERFETAQEDLNTVPASTGKT